MSDGISGEGNNASISGVVAKMECSSVDTTEYGNENYRWKQIKVNLGAVVGNSGENKDFTDATPSGHCWMVIKEDRPAAHFFKPGKKYYVHFTEATD